ncbi:glycoside hydrolase family 25 protein [Actinopolyspora saharensis]|uniref:glycoside hydrolase family 25 protein n=1 Tax=Actinopolyspora saharensis TaxID=995062 RepID=UPI003F66C836
MIYGIDVSHHQGPFDMHRARAESFEFVFIKATEGDGFVDPRFRDNLAAARSAGLLTAAYHYQREGSTAAAQADHIAATVPTDVPVILDVEDGGGGTRLTRALTEELHGRGFRTPLLYLPEWYWQQLGNPDLSGFPPLWKSRYPDNRGGYASEIYQRVPEHFWNGYGGNQVAVLQFTSSATVAGQNPVDANAYLGTRQDVENLLAPEGEDMRDDERNALFDILQQLTASRTPGEFTGWPSYVDQSKRFTLVDFTRWIDKHAFELHQQFAQGKNTAELAAGGDGQQAENEQALRSVIAEAVNSVLDAEDPRREEVVDAVTARLTSAAPPHKAEQSSEGSES